MHIVTFQRIGTPVESVGERSTSVLDDGQSMPCLCICRKHVLLSPFYKQKLAFALDSDNYWRRLYVRVIDKDETVWFFKVQHYSETISVKSPEFRSRKICVAFFYE